MIRIGIFSRISQTPVSTLRYYDEIGLLKAAQVDNFSGYRYYTLDQLHRLHRIQALKEMGLSLDEVQRLLEHELSLAELCGMLRLKQAELNQRVQEEQARLKRLEDWLFQIEQEEVMPEYDVFTKKVTSMPVVAVCAVIPNYPQQGALWDQLDDYLQRYQLHVRGPGVTVYHQEEPHIEAEVCLEIDRGDFERGLPQDGRVQVHELPAIETAAAVVYKGPLNGIGEGFKALISWIERQGYQINGPLREVYLRGPKAHSQTDPGVMVEIQAPVVKE